MSSGNLEAGYFVQEYLGYCLFSDPPCQDMQFLQETDQFKNCKCPMFVKIPLNGRKQNQQKGKTKQWLSENVVSSELCQTGPEKCVPGNCECQGAWATAGLCQVRLLVLLFYVATAIQLNFVSLGKQSRNQIRPGRSGMREIICGSLCAYL